MKQVREGAKVSTFSRVLAWIFLVCAVFAMGGMLVTAIVQKKWHFGSEEFAFLLGMLIICPLFLFVAVKGRSPRWLTSLESIHDKVAKARGIRTPERLGSRKLIPVVASVVFGLGLVLFGNQLGIFSGETGWFAMSVFGACWLIVVFILWHNSKDKRPRQSAKDADSMD